GEYNMLLNSKIIPHIKTYMITPAGNACIAILKTPLSLPLSIVNVSFGQGLDYTGVSSINKLCSLSPQILELNNGSLKVITKNFYACEYDLCMESDDNEDETSTKIDLLRLILINGENSSLQDFKSQDRSRFATGSLYTNKQTLKTIKWNTETLKIGV